MSNMAPQIEKVLMHGDLTELSAEQRLSYVKSVCESLGLNYLTRPFDYIKLNNKLTLYAKRDATDQMRKVHRVSIEITSRELIDGIYVVTAKATDATGRQDTSTGAVSVEGLKGEAKANAMLKAETKAKRRVTLSICGLGLLDETEVESIQGERDVPKKSPLIAHRENRAAAPEDYCPTFGRYKGMRLGDITIHELDDYCHYIQNEAIRTGKGIQGQVLEFIEKAGELIESRASKAEETA